MTTNDFLFLQDALVGKANVLLKEIMTLVKVDEPQKTQAQTEETKTEKE